MADIDDEVLAYAMALGRRFELIDPLPGRAKKASQYRETLLDARSTGESASKYADRSALVAHFIARLMSDRRVKVKDRQELSSKWLIEDGHTGMGISFEAPPEKEVRALLSEASVMKADADLDPVDAAAKRMRLARERRERAIVASRSADKKWPPAEGSTEARVLALARDVEEFETCRRVNRTRTWTSYKRTTASAFLAKLKDRSLRIQEVEAHPHGSKGAMVVSLRPGELFVEVSFSKTDDAGDLPISTYVWVTKEEADPALKKSPRGKSKSAG